MFAGLKRELNRKKSKKGISKGKSTKPVVNKRKGSKSKKSGYRTKKSRPKSKKKSSRKKKTSKRKKSMRGGAIRYPSEYYGKNSGRYGEDNHKGASFPVPNLTPTV